ncbi:hypothetical protein RBB75_13940 [Tunturibacter empetritectus]|uniref:Uncharacterized protein n=1 Tax=Tunturiibacter empetritectus TaxID=3069691 RepID=A0AAU7Z9A9_9BACT
MILSQPAKTTDIRASNNIASQLTEHGTCAVGVFTDKKMAFVIDSRMTLTSNGKYLGHKEGCKVVLARPKVLLAATGVEDSIYDVNHWNALEQAQAAMKLLPENPTYDQLDAWGLQWAQTMWGHYRNSGAKPDYTGVVSQLFVMTKIDGQTYVLKPTVTWDGVRFGFTSIFAAVSPEASTQYSGVCRKFVTTHDQAGAHPREIPVTAEELREMNAIGDDRVRAQTIGELTDVATRFELKFTAIDERLEGDYASIGAPYSTASWDEGALTWKTKFNPACSAKMTGTVASK